jgi:hypothetical protein
LTFAGAGDAFVKTWYDQSGSSNDATQTTTANQPKIVSSGAVILAEGKPSIYFEVNDKYENITASISTLHSAFAVAKSPDQNRKQIYGFGGALAYKYFEFGFHNGYLTATFLGNGSSYNSYSSSQGVNTAVNLFSNIYNGTTYESYVDNTASVNASQTLTSSAALSIGARQNYTMYLSELVLYSSDKSTNRTGIEENIGGYYDIPLAKLLDTYTGAAAAYSLRRLSSTYTGSAIKVQDNVGGATLDVGFDSYGDLDTAVIAAYGGSNDVFVETWYDQSGNGNNATQATSANRPKIYDGATGAVIVENGKPAVQFDNSDDYFEFPITYSTTSIQLHSVFATSDTQWIMLRDSTAPSKNIPVAQAGSTGTPIDGVTSANFYKNSALQSISTRAQVVTTYSTGTQGLMTINGNIASTGSSTILFGRYVSSFSMNAKHQELVIYTTDETSNRTGIETNINDFYSIY